MTGVISISLPPKMVWKIDKVRGDVSRSRYILRILEKELEKQEENRK
jgi:metal-responsive CopG/Arc/MetJ family transcriptional regulator